MTDHSREQYRKPTETRGTLGHHPAISGLSFTHETADSLRVLNFVGARIIRAGDSFAVGMWQDLDCNEIRACIVSVGMADLGVVHLDGPGVPPQYNVRRCADRFPKESFNTWFRRAERERATISINTRDKERAAVPHGRGGYLSRDIF